MDSQVKVRVVSWISQILFKIGKQYLHLLCLPSRELGKSFKVRASRPSWICTRSRYQLFSCRPSIILISQTICCQHMREPGTSNARLLAMVLWVDETSHAERSQRPHLSSFEPGQGSRPNLWAVSSKVVIQEIWIKNFKDTG